ncbi:MAG: LolA family protein [Bacteroidia bacterium]
MNKSKKVFALILLSFGLLAGHGLNEAKAQKKTPKTRSIASGDAESKAILSKLSKNYRSMKSMQALVSLELQGGPGQVKEKRKGKLYLRGKQYRIDMGEQLIVCDGRSSWTYLKELNEVNISRHEPTPEQITPDNLFTMYEKGFDSFLESESVAGKSLVSLIDLIPQNKSLSYFKVRLYVDCKNNLIQKAVVFDKSGVQYTYQISEFKVNPKLRDDLFVFNVKAYPNVEVVDMR